MPRVVPSQVVELIDQLFPQYRFGSTSRNGWYNSNLDRCYGLQAVLDLTDQIPSSLVVLNGQDYSVLVSSIAAIRNVMDNPLTGPYGIKKIELAPIEEFGNVNPIALIRDLLSRCPDEFPSPGTAELAFITDATLRDSLRNDIGTINRALSDNEWKGATVLAGSLVEALLLWALQQKGAAEVTRAVGVLVSNQTLSRAPSANLEEWSLHEYIEVSTKLGLIAEDAANQARLAKDFRNLIHPGRSQRLGQVCNRGTALSAVAAVEHVVDELTP